MFVGNKALIEYFCSKEVIGDGIFAYETFGKPSWQAYLHSGGCSCVNGVIAVYQCPCKQKEVLLLSFVANLAVLSIKVILTEA